MPSDKPTCSYVWGELECTTGGDACHCVNELGVGQRKRL
jgi:hypothetical protein